MRRFSLEKRVLTRWGAKNRHVSLNRCPRKSMHMYACMHKGSYPNLRRCMHAYVYGIYLRDYAYAPVYVCMWIYVFICI